MRYLYIIVSVCVALLLGCDVESPSVDTTDTSSGQMNFINTTSNNVLVMEHREGVVWTRQVEVPLSIPTSYVDVGCQSVQDCDDINPCTEDVCELGVCSHGTVDDGTSCADWNVCDGAEICHAGICTRSARPMLCDDGNPDTIDFCDPKLGRCRSKTSCGDGRRSCQTDAECDDTNPDTDDFCDAGTCTSSPVEGCYGLEVNDCWQFYTNINDTYSSVYPFGGVGWERCRNGNCQQVTWCGDEFVSMNLESTSSPQAEELSRTSVWALDWHDCFVAEIYRQMFIGPQPEDMGCHLFCVSSSNWPEGQSSLLMWQCHPNYLPSGG